ncbi:MAG: PKD domain-containing protein [Planctomycetota bacterium]|nr:PKD domain-containing protein [Planctomycetota bacterium]
MPATIVRRARPTLTAVELDCGEALEFVLDSGRTVRLELLSTSARVLLTSNRDTRVEERQGRTILLCVARVRIDGHELELNRFLCAQESFAEPYVVNGLRFWFDGTADLFELITEGHGVCRPRKHARFALQDAARGVCPEPLHPWCPKDENAIDIKECYNGDDCWLGPYLGASAHGGLDINHPKGTPLWAPIDFDEQFYFECLAGGANNNRHRALRTWPDGSAWTLQAHHMYELCVPEHTPLKRGAEYAKAAGVLNGSHNHTHFVFKVAEPGTRAGADDVLLDPWILFWQTFEDARRAGTELRAEMQAPGPARAGEPVAFSSEGSRPGPGGAALKYVWTFGDGGCSFEPHPRYAYARPGLYAATLTVDDGSNRATATQHLTVDGEPYAGAAPVLVAPDEPAFRVRPARQADLYARPPRRLPRTLRFVARASRPRPAARILELRSRGLKHELKRAACEVAFERGAGWLTVKAQGSATSQELLVSADATGLTPGLYAATVRAMVGEALNGTLPFRVELLVKAEPPPPGESVVDDAGEGCEATPFFWVAPRFSKFPVRGFGGDEQDGGGFLSNGGRAEPGEYVRFTPDLAAGAYEVAFHPLTPFAPGDAFNVRVRHRGGAATVRVQPFAARRIGRFEFDEGCDGFVELLAAGSAGQVLADAVVFTPAIGGR